MQVAERVSQLGRELAQLRGSTPAKFSSDIETAEALCEAAMKGALANVLINLDSIQEQSFRASMQEKMNLISASGRE